MEEPPATGALLAAEGKIGSARSTLSAEPGAPTGKDSCQMKFYHG